MKLCLACPATGCQKTLVIEDERKLRNLNDKYLGCEIDGTLLGDEWKGYILRIVGGNDKQGFPMKEGIMTTNRVRVLLNKNTGCYRPKRKGERRRKSVRGAVIDSNLSALSMIVVKIGDRVIPDLTDKTVPRTLGPKRANNVRKLFNLTKKDDVRLYISRRTIVNKEGKKRKARRCMKIQRLVTPKMIYRKRRLRRLNTQRRMNRMQAEEDYVKLLRLRKRQVKMMRLYRTCAVLNKKARQEKRKTNLVEKQAKAEALAQAKARAKAKLHVKPIKKKRRYYK